jgi:3-deoxy-D-manno-octulosonic-acid transferase
MLYIYNLFIRIYSLAVYLATPFHPKARLWVNGRKNLLLRIEEALHPEDRIIWFHAASLGEFEQGRPIMEEVKKKLPKYKILLTFFSPSGYEVRKNFAGADYIFYLPADTPRNAWRFVQTAEPEMAVFVKYEFWFNYIRFLYMRDIPLIYVSAIFRPGQFFFKSYGRWFRKILQQVRFFFVQNRESLELLQSINIQHATLSGDTRFDRVWTAAQSRKEFPLIRRFAGSHQVILAGSTWPADEEIMLQFMKGNKAPFKYIIAPHEIHPKRIVAFIERSGLNCLRYSEATEEHVDKAQVLIIDSIGILLHLYQYAGIAYIGGGFGKNIHNILEAATFGVPVIFGPKYHKFQEAHDLLLAGGAFTIRNGGEFRESAHQLLDDPGKLKAASEACRNYVESKTGATEQIIKKIIKDLKTPKIL